MLYERQTAEKWTCAICSSVSNTDVCKLNVFRVLGAECESVFCTSVPLRNVAGFLQHFYNLHVGERHEGQRQEVEEDHLADYEEGVGGVGPDGRALLEVDDCGVREAGDFGQVDGLGDLWKKSQLCEKNRNEF